MVNASMELDSPEQQQQQEPEVVVEDRTLAFEIADAVAAITPPQSTSNTPQRNSSVPVPEQQMREIDSAAPESPGGSRYYGDNMEDLSSSDEDKGDRAAELARPPSRPSRKGFSRSAARRLDMDDPNISDESERVEHTDFFNNFGQDWLTTQ
ncbi:hypothetical protein GGH94_005225 [Coemansia aciculifera]|uniref:Uncharacterized protein n=1 Tax=Coemansia aciculifera TaxID=417176 RepID=A0A9W8M3C2_9FUNG|nr:hypothetical protein GGH94_005225 [Coemansia aciculifera]